MAKAKIKWYPDEVKKAALEAVNLEGVAFRVEETAKANIVRNDQVDTGFMLNSTYVVLPDRSTYSGGEGIGPKPDVKANQAAVVVGANYAIYQEIQQSFLFSALNQVTGELGGIVKKL